MLLELFVIRGQGFLPFNVCFFHLFISLRLKVVECRSDLQYSYVFAKY